MAEMPIAEGLIDFDDVLVASRRIAGVVHRTPVVTSRGLDAQTGATVLCKAENLQRGGSFKLRGAYNRIVTATEEQRRRGVIAYSSGNHAQAVALAARLLGLPSLIVMPNDAADVKRAATESYGAEIVTYDRRREDRVEIAQRIAHDRRLLVVPPYDHPLVMAGQGTAALELIEDAGPVELLVVPVGGGGLIAGCATATKGLHPDTRVVGVEPAAADDTRRSLVAGRRIRVDHSDSIADGLLASVPGRLTFQVNRRLVDEVVTVTDTEIVAAMAFLVDRTKLVTEPSGACAAAALLAGKVHAAGARVGILLSGGNVGARRLGRLLTREW